MATDISRKENVTNTQLYRGMPNISELITQRILRLVCHCVRHTDKLTHNFTAYETERNNPRHS